MLGKNIAIQSVESFFQRGPGEPLPILVNQLINLQSIVNSLDTAPQVTELNRAQEIIAAVSQNIEANPAQYYGSNTQGRLAYLDENVAGYLTRFTSGAYIAVTPPALASLAQELETAKITLVKKHAQDLQTCPGADDPDLAAVSDKQEKTEAIQILTADRLKTRLEELAEAHASSASAEIDNAAVLRTVQEILPGAHNLRTDNGQPYYLRLSADLKEALQLEALWSSPEERQNYIVEIENQEYFIADSAPNRILLAQVIRERHNSYLDNMLEAAKDTLAFAGLTASSIDRPAVEKKLIDIAKIYAQLAVLAKQAERQGILPRGARTAEHWWSKAYASLEAAVPRKGFLNRVLRQSRLNELCAALQEKAAQYAAALSPETGSPSDTRAPVVHRSVFHRAPPIARQRTTTVQRAPDTPHNRSSVRVLQRDLLAAGNWTEFIQLAGAQEAATEAELIAIRSAATRQFRANFEVNSDSKEIAEQILLEQKLKDPARAAIVQGIDNALRRRYWPLMFIPPAVAMAALLSTAAITRSAINNWQGRSGTDAAVSREAIEMEQPSIESHFPSSASGGKPQANIFTNMGRDTANPPFAETGEP